MEASCDGILIRRFHCEWARIKIRHDLRSKFRVQRVRTPDHPQELTIVCSSPYVSKIHGEIFRKHNAYWIKDCKSTNGTYLNGFKIGVERERELRFGDVIGFGVSHEETDPEINVKDLEFFIFDFKRLQTVDKKYTPPVEVDLANSPEGPENNDDEEINGLFDSVEESVSGSTASTSSSSPVKKHQRKAAPPPPIISKLPGPKSKKNGNNSPRPLAVIVKQKPKSSKHGPPSKPLVSSSSNMLKPVKTVCKKEVSYDPESSTDGDDSSDGLGDVDHSANRKISFPRPPDPNSATASTYSGVSSPSSYGSNEEDTIRPEDDESPPIKSEWKGAPSSSSSKGSVATYTKTEIIKENNESIDSSDYEDSTSEDTDFEEEVLRLEATKKSAMHAPCVVKLDRVVCHTKTGKFRMIPYARKLTTSEIRSKLKRQYLGSLMASRMTPEERKRRAHATSESNKGDKRRLPSSSSSSDSLSEIDVDKPGSHGVKKPKRQRILRAPSSSSSNEEQRDQSPRPTRLQVLVQPGKDEETSSSEDNDVPEGLVLEPETGSIPLSDEDSEPLSDEPSPKPISEDEDMEINAEEADDVESKSHEDDQNQNQPMAPAGPRRIQLLVEDVPTPRFVQIAQKKHAPFKRPMPPTISNARIITEGKTRYPTSTASTSSSSVPRQMTQEERKKAISEKLRRIEEKKRLERGDEAPKAAKPPPAKIKFSSRNRNQGLMEDIVGKFSDKDSVVGMPPYRPPTMNTSAAATATASSSETTSVLTPAPFAFKMPAIPPTPTISNASTTTRMDDSLVSPLAGPTANQPKTSGYGTKFGPSKKPSHPLQKSEQQKPSSSFGSNDPRKKAEPPRRMPIDVPKPYQSMSSSNPPERAGPPNVSTDTSKAGLPKKLTDLLEKAQQSKTLNKAATPNQPKNSGDPRQTTEPPRNTTSNAPPPTPRPEEPRRTIPIVLEDPRINRGIYMTSGPSSMPSMGTTPSSSAIGKPFPHNPNSTKQNAAASSSSNSVKSTGHTILKRGAEIILSPTGDIGNFRNSDRYPKDHSKHKSFHKKQIPFKSEDDIYRKMLNWQPSWIQEQKNQEVPPPVSGEESVHSTLKTYLSFEVYFNTYYPLLLHEVWGTLSNDSEKKDQQKVSLADDTFHRRVSEYNIKIDDCKQTKICELTRSKVQNKEAIWITIKYHTWVKNLRDIDTKKDFLILTLAGHEKERGKEVRHKDVFAFSLFNTESYVPYNSKNPDIDSRLVGKATNGFKFMEKLVIKVPTAFSLTTEHITKVERLCQVTQKIREFKSLNFLQYCPLFKEIVMPSEVVSNVWTENFPCTNDILTICNQKLNTEQKSMISYITSRVYSDGPDLMLMHGPPGSGKTLTIVCLILQILHECKRRRPNSSNRRILVCTPSNAAIDEIMRRLIQAQKYLPSTFFSRGNELQLVRIGEGYCKDLEKYSLNSKVKERDQGKSAVQSLKVELTSINDDILEKEAEIAGMKEKEPKNKVGLQAKLSALQELEAKKRRLEVDLDAEANRRDFKQSTDQRKQQVLLDSDIICSTLSSSSNALMKNTMATICQGNKTEKPFLCCIIDEASQTTEPESLLPLAMDINKLLLVGDPHQLGATVLAQLAEDKGYGQSLFSRLFEFYNRKKIPKNPVMMLSRQYRMHEEIVKWPNAFFYDSRLVTKYRLPRSDFPLRPYYFLNLTTGREQANFGQIENVQEVQLVQAIVNTLDDVLLPLNSKWTIGVITPYAKQKSLLRKEFKDKQLKCFESIEVDTVDGFQGQEKDIVLLSCVRTDATGFLKSRNRLNVALTRAKHSLYIIGDANCLSKDEMWKCLIQDAAQRNCKLDVGTNFSSDVKHFQKNILRPKLTERVIRQNYGLIND